MVVPCALLPFSWCTAGAASLFMPTTVLFLAVFSLVLSHSANKLMPLYCTLLLVLHSTSCASILLGIHKISACGLSCMSTVLTAVRCDGVLQGQYQTWALLSASCLTTVGFSFLGILDAFLKWRDPRRPVPHDRAWQASHGFFSPLPLKLLFLVHLLLIPLCLSHVWSTRNLIIHKTHHLLLILLLHLEWNHVNMQHAKYALLWIHQTWLHPMSLTNSLMQYVHKI